MAHGTLIESYLQEFNERIDELDLEIVENDECSINIPEQLERVIPHSLWWETTDSDDVVFLPLYSFAIKYPDISLDADEIKLFENEERSATVDLVKIFAVSCKCSKFFETERTIDRESTSQTYCRFCGQGDIYQGVYKYEQIYSHAEYEEKLEAGFEANSEIADLLQHSE